MWRPLVPLRQTESEAQLSRQGLGPCWPKLQKRTFPGTLPGRTDLLDLRPRSRGRRIERRTSRRIQSPRKRKERIGRDVRTGPARTAVSESPCEKELQTNTPQG